MAAARAAKDRAPVGIFPKAICYFLVRFEAFPLLLLELSFLECAAIMSAIARIVHISYSDELDSDGIFTNIPKAL
jgi:hypothetical protein